MLEEYINQVIVIDTPHSLQYIGKLKRFDEFYIELIDVDVHDNQDSRSTKEMYIMEAKRDFVKANRKATLVKQTSVVSISRLDDIIVF